MYTSLVSVRCVIPCFSATDALKGEGLQEGVDWLQGTTTDVHDSESVEHRDWHALVFSVSLYSGASILS